MNQTYQEDVKTVIIGGTGDGGLSPGTKGEAVTSGMQPNIAYTVIGPALAIFVRFAHLFGVTWLALMATGGMTGQEILPWVDLQQLATKCAYAATITAGMGSAKDVVTLFGKLEQKFPFLTGNV